MKPVFSLLLLICSFSATAQNIYSYNTLPGGAGLEPNLFTVFQGKLYFTGTDSANGLEIWSIDTLDAQPKLTVDTRPGPADGTVYIYNYGSLGVVGDTMYYNGHDSLLGYELYSYDGVNPPKLRKDLAPGSGNAAPRHFYTIDDKLYFVGGGYFSSVIPLEIYQLIPATGQFRTLKHSICHGQQYLWYDVLWMAAFKGKLSFDNNNLCYPKTWPDGTAHFEYDPVADTIIGIDNFYQYGPSSTCYDYDARLLTIYNDKMYLSVNACNPSTPGSLGNELFEWDGVNKPKMLVDLNPNGNGVWHLSYKGAAGYNNAIYFAGDNGSTGMQLYKHDLGTGVTSFVHQIGNIPNPSGSNLSDMIVYNKKLYFGGGTQLWVYDFVDTPRKIPNVYISQQSCFKEYAGSLFFGGSVNGDGMELCKLTDTLVMVSWHDTAFCKGQTFPVSYFATLPFGTGNTFTAELSDASGSFASPVAIGSVSAATSGVINCTIPASTPTGNGYRIRVTSSNPALTSEPGRAIRIATTVAAQITLSASATTVPVGGVVKFTTAVTNGGTAPNYRWTNNNTLLSGITVDTANITIWQNSNICVELTSNSGCASPAKDTDCISITAVGVEGINNYHDLKIYPNPNKGSFKIDGVSQATTNAIEVANVYGQVVFKEIIQGKVLNKIIDLDIAADGVYMLKIYSDKGQIVKRIIVAR